MCDTDDDILLAAKLAAVKLLFSLVRAEAELVLILGSSFAVISLGFS